MNFLKAIKQIVDNIYVYINAIFVVVFGISCSYLGEKQDISKQYLDEHPVRAVVFHFLNESLFEIVACIGIFWFILTIINVYGHQSLSSIRSDLTKEKEKNSLIANNVESLFEGFLYQFATNKLGFGTQATNNERITLYIHDGRKHLVPFGRYSQNPVYRGKGRTQYPDHEGCISKAWQDGWCFDNTFPTDEISRVEKHHADYGISKRDARAFHMPSRLYAALNISDDNGKQIAVIVVESTEDNRYNEAALKAELINNQKYLAEMITRLGNYIPKPSVAKVKGL